MINKKIIVVGATGKVGLEMLSILSEESVPQNRVFAAASSKSEGKLISVGDYKDIPVQSLEKVDFAEYDIALFSAGGSVSKEYAPKAAERGCVVIDNTSCFRMNEGVPLIVPEINFDDLKKYSNTSIISNPNCSTIQMVMALKPLHDEFNLKEVVVSSYQSVSGAGQKGVCELLEQTKQVLLEEKANPQHFKKQIAFNVIPQIDEFTDSLYTKEEIKMMEETKKIFGKQDIKITATCVRVPVLIGHAVSVYAVFEQEVDLLKALVVLNDFEGVEVKDDVLTFDYACPLDCAHSNAVYVSRLRKHPEDKKVLNFWCVADNLRKGAALNAVQIAKKL